MPHALVTGGTRGIERSLLAAGYTVTATGLADEELAAAQPTEGLALMGAGFLLMLLGAFLATGTTTATGTG
jgi:hypothetical protein